MTVLGHFIERQLIDRIFLGQEYFIERTFTEDNSLCGHFIKGHSLD